MLDFIINVTKRQFRKTWKRFVYSVLSVGILTILTLIGWAYIEKSYKEYSTLSEQIVASVFLDSNSDSLDIIFAREQLKLFPEVASVTVTTSDQAKNDFESKYHAPIDSILPYNPFPVVLTVTLTKDYSNSNGTQFFSEKCKKLPMITDVMTRTAFVKAVDERKNQYSLFLNFGIPFVLFLLISLLYFNFSTWMKITSAESRIFELLSINKKLILLPRVVLAVIAIILGLSIGFSSTLAVVTKISNLLSLPHIDMMQFLLILLYLLGFCILQLVVIYLKNLRFVSQTLTHE